MEMKLNPWQRFLVCTAALFVTLVVALNFGGAQWLVDQYQDPLTIQLALAMLVLLFLLYILGGGGAALHIRREQRALVSLRTHGQLASRAPVLKALWAEVQACTSITSQRKMKVDPFIEAYEQKLSRPIESLRRSENFLVGLGLLGTVAGLILGFSGSDADFMANAAAAQEFSFKALQSVGLALVTTFIGLGGSQVIKLLRVGYESIANDMVSDFGLHLERHLLGHNVSENGD